MRTLLILSVLLFVVSVVDAGVTYEIAGGGITTIGPLTWSIETIDGVDKLVGIGVADRISEMRDGLGIEGPIAGINPDGEGQYPGSCTEAAGVLRQVSDFFGWSGFDLSAGDHICSERFPCSYDGIWYIFDIMGPGTVYVFDYGVNLYDPAATFEIILSSGGSVLVVSDNNFSFSAKQDRANPEPQQLTISSSGSDVLNWTITEECDWLEVDSISGQCGAEPNHVTISIDTTGLEPGYHSCDLQITAPEASNPPVTVSISLLVFGPLISVSNQEFSFDALEGRSNPQGQDLIIQNIGGGELNWYIDKKGCDWLTASPENGSITEETDTVTIGADISGLAAGMYSCIPEPRVETYNRIKILSVSLRVIGPIIELDESELGFSADVGETNPAVQSFSIKNIGGGTLEWQLIEDCPWLSFRLASGSSITDNDEVTVQADISGLDAGYYSYVVNVTDSSAENNPQKVRVNLTVNGPEIALSTKTVGINVEEDETGQLTRTLKIRNSGIGVLQWQIVEDCSWLWVSPDQGSITDEIGDATINMNLDALTPGTHTCSLGVLGTGAMNSPQEVTVTVKKGDACYEGEDYDEWVAVGRPESWCNDLQTSGDASGSSEVFGRGFVSIGMNDVRLLIEGFRKPYFGDPVAQPWIAADFDHAAEPFGRGMVRVGMRDVNILMLNLRKR